MLLVQAGAGMLGKVFFLCTCRVMAPQAATVVEAAALALVLPASFRSPNVIGGALGTVKSGNLVVDAARSLALPTMVVAGLRAIGKVLPFRRRKQEAALEEDDLLVDGAEEAAPRGKVPDIVSGSTRALPPIPDLSKYGDTTGTSLTATQYTDIYKDWVRLVKQQLDRRRVNLPPGAFDPEGREIMRFCIISGLTLAKTPREAVRAVALAVQKISLTAHWWTRFKFVSDAEMQEFKNIVWYSGPDDEGFCWLNVDAGKAVQRTGADAQRAAMAIQTAMENGARRGVSEMGAKQDKFKVLVIATGGNLNQTMRIVPICQTVALTIYKHYPYRMEHMYVVGLSPWLRIGFEAVLGILGAHTRKKIKILRKLSEVPGRPNEGAGGGMSRSTSVGSLASLELISAESKALVTNIVKGMKPVPGLSSNMLAAVLLLALVAALLSNPGLLLAPMALAAGGDVQLGGGAQAARGGAAMPTHPLLAQ